MTNTTPAPTRAVFVDDWQEVNGEVSRYFHEAHHPIPGVPGAYYSFAGRQLADSSVVDREMYVHPRRRFLGGRRPINYWGLVGGAYRSPRWSPGKRTHVRSGGNAISLKTHVCFECHELRDLAHERAVAAATAVQCMTVCSRRRRMHSGADYR
jgi:hypothetical protein